MFARDAVRMQVEIPKQLPFVPVARTFNGFISNRPTSVD